MFDQARNLRFQKFFIILFMKLIVKWKLAQMRNNLHSLTYDEKKSSKLHSKMSKSHVRLQAHRTISTDRPDVNKLAIRSRLTKPKTPRSNSAFSPRILFAYTLFRSGKVPARFYWLCRDRSLSRPSTLSPVSFKERSPGRVGGREGGVGNARNNPCDIWGNINRYEVVCRRLLRVYGHSFRDCYQCLGLWGQWVRLTRNEVITRIRAYGSSNNANCNISLGFMHFTDKIYGTKEIEEFVDQFLELRAKLRKILQFRHFSNIWRQNWLTFRHSLFINTDDVDLSGSSKLECE